MPAAFSMPPPQNGSQVRLGCRLVEATPAVTGVVAGDEQQAERAVAEADCAFGTMLAAARESKPAALGCERRGVHQRS